MVYGDAGDDDLIGGWGHDWISGGTGQDGVLGDDGRIFTARNGTAEPLNGIAATVQTSAATPGSHQTAAINPTGKLNKLVDLTPFALNPRTATDRRRRPASRPLSPTTSSSAAWAATSCTAAPATTRCPGRRPSSSPTRRRHRHRPQPVGLDGALQPRRPAAVQRRPRRPVLLYDEYDPRRLITLNANGTANKTNAACTNFGAGQTAGCYQWLLNNDRRDGVPAGTDVFDDGDDVLFGDYGNDWLVGGTGRDTLWGGWGNDQLNADDDLTTNGNLNDGPDTHTTYEDRAVGGAGLDVLIGNTGGDRLIDWVGEFNSFLVPFSPFGMSTVSRQVPPGLMEFLYALSRAQGADPTRAQDTGAGSEPRNGEPYGEAGIVTQKDDAWGDQTGGPRDPQAGNSKAARTSCAAADFNAGSFDGFLVDSGVYSTSPAARCRSRPPARRATPPPSGTSTSTCPCTTRSPAPSRRQADGGLEGQRLHHLRLLQPDRLQVRRRRRLHQRRRDGPPQRQRLDRRREDAAPVRGRRLLQPDADA